MDSKRKIKDSCVIAKTQKTNNTTCPRTRKVFSGQSPIHASHKTLAACGVQKNRISGAINIKDKVDKINIKAGVGVLGVHNKSNKYSKI
jgi:hypothetical protein